MRASVHPAGQHCLSSVQFFFGPGVPVGRCWFNEATCVSLWLVFPSQVITSSSQQSGHGHPLHCSQASRPHCPGTTAPGSDSASQGAVPADSQGSSAETLAGGVGAGRTCTAQRPLGGLWALRERRHGPPAAGVSSVAGQSIGHRLSAKHRAVSIRVPAGRTSCAAWHCSGAWGPHPAPALWV